MNPNAETNRVRSETLRALSARSPRSLVLLLSLCTSLPAAAQGTRVVVSTTDDVAVTAGLPFPGGDGDLLAVESAQPPSPYLAGGHFQASCGFIPGDIDAFAHLPGSRPGRAGGRVFSLLSNEGGFLDGDLIAVGTAGGASLLISELDLATALGDPSANIDVDALAYDDQGRVLFSLNTDLTTPTLGLVKDGDVYRLELGFTGVTLVLDEGTVQAAFTLATGLPDAVLDLQALEWAGGELWGAVQSPTRHDGSIIAFGTNPRVVLDENAMGLAGAEVDALGDLRPGDEIPVFHISPEGAFPGDMTHIETRGRPGAVLMVLMAGNTGFINFPRAPGFGGWYFARNDAWLNAVLTTRSIPFVFLDGAGKYSVDWALPTGTEAGLGLAGELGWSFQLMDVATREVSAPFRVQAF